MAKTPKTIPQQTKFYPPPPDLRPKPGQIKTSRMTEEDYIALGERAPVALEDTDEIDTTILKVVLPRLWCPAPLEKPILALEVTDGPYQGVIFSYRDFTVLDHDLGNGYVPAKFETRVWKSPPDFRADEAFDEFCRELFLTWLSYINDKELRTLIHIPPTIPTRQ